MFNYINKKYIIFVPVMALFLFFVLPSHPLHIGYFQGALADEYSNLPGADLTITSIEDIIQGLACWIYRIAFLLIIIFIVLTGIRYISSGGNPTKLTSAHQSFKWVVIGAVVILGVGVIIATIANFLGVDVPFPGLC